MLDLEGDFAFHKTTFCLPEPIIRLNHIPEDGILLRDHSDGHSIMDCSEGVYDGGQFRAGSEKYWYYVPEIVRRSSYPTLSPKILYAACVHC